MVSLRKQSIKVWYSKAQLDSLRLWVFSSSQGTINRVPLRYYLVTTYYRVPFKPQVLGF